MAVSSMRVGSLRSFVHERMRSEPKMFGNIFADMQTEMSSSGRLSRPLLWDSPCADIIRRLIEQVLRGLSGTTLLEGITRLKIVDASVLVRRAGPSRSQILHKDFDFPWDSQVLSVLIPLDMQCSTLFMVHSTANSMRSRFLKPFLFPGRGYVFDAKTMVHAETAVTFTQSPMPMMLFVGLENGCSADARALINLSQFAWAYDYFSVESIIRPSACCRLCGMFLLPQVLWDDNINLLANQENTDALRTSRYRVVINSDLDPDVAWACEFCTQAATLREFGPKGHVPLKTTHKAVYERLEDDRLIAVPLPDSLRAPEPCEIIFLLYSPNELRHAFSKWVELYKPENRELLTRIPEGTEWERLAELRFGTECPRAARILAVTGRALGIRRPTPRANQSGKSLRTSKAEAAFWPKKKPAQHALAVTKRTEEADLFARDLNKIEEQQHAEMRKLATTHLRNWHAGIKTTVSNHACIREPQSHKDLTPRDCFCLGTATPQQAQSNPPPPDTHTTPQT